MKSLKALTKSFNHAWQGLLIAFKEEQSFRYQLIAALVVAILLIALPLERWERALLILCIGGVLVLELLNSIIERFVDIVKPRVHEYARIVKDLSAAAVLVMAITAVILAIIIFWPHIYLLGSL
ncbi:MAG: diacylglycerol kinase family protein [Patescibacteria group bacterium]|nr:diacylglycerol kinase family protein [Patescibacteria group bacterium]